MDHIHCFFIFSEVRRGHFNNLFWLHQSTGLKNYLVVFLTRPRTCAEQGDVFEADLEAWLRVTESSASLATVTFSRRMRFFCEKSYFTSQGQTLFPPRPFFEPLWRGCSMSCCYNLVSSQLLSCRQQQGAQHGLNTQVFTLICWRILHPVLSFVLLQWYLRCTTAIA